MRTFSFKDDPDLAEVVHSSLHAVMERNLVLERLGVSHFDHYDYDLAAGTLAFSYCEDREAPVVEPRDPVRFSVLPIGTFGRHGQTFAWVGPAHPSLSGCPGAERIVRLREEVARAQPDLLDLVSSASISADEESCWGLAGLLLRTTDLGIYLANGTLYLLVTGKLPMGELT
jgi:hypothetical protein